MSLKINNMMRY